MDLQLPLGLTLDQGATFANFVAGDNATAVRAVAACAGEGDPAWVYLWGPPGSGRTHLLQAACRRAADAHSAVAYIPFNESGQLAPDILQGMDGLALVCLDDIDLVAGQERWEFALFTLLNRVRENNGRVVLSAAAAPEATGLALADLVSRLNWATRFRLAPLDDDHKLRALQVRAQARGLEMADEVGRYLLQRQPREMSSLFALLERLDRASLAAQRRLTIPFVKTLLDRDSS